MSVNSGFYICRNIVYCHKLQSSSLLADDKDDKQDIRILNELENIDDDLDREGIVIIRIDNDAEAKEYGIDHLPALIYFEDKIPAIYEGKTVLYSKTIKTKNIEG